MEKKIMKVDLAVQTLACSTADSMNFLMQEGYTEFRGAEPTIDFPRLFNDLFNVFNSRSNVDNPMKAALRDNSKNRIFSLFDYLCD